MHSLRNRRKTGLYRPTDRSTRPRHQAQHQRSDLHLRSHGGTTVNEECLRRMASDIRPSSLPNPNRRRLAPLHPDLRFSLPPAPRQPSSSLLTTPPPPSIPLHRPLLPHQPRHLRTQTDIHLLPFISTGGRSTAFTSSVLANGTIAVFAGDCSVSTSAPLDLHPQHPNHGDMDAPRHRPRHVLGLRPGEALQPRRQHRLLPTTRPRHLDATLTSTAACVRDHLPPPPPAESSKPRPTPAACCVSTPPAPRPPPPEGTPSRTPPPPARPSPRPASRSPRSRHPSPTAPASSQQAGHVLLGGHTQQAFEQHEHRGHLEPAGGASGVSSASRRLPRGAGPISLSRRRRRRCRQPLRPYGGA